jgi:predicted nucleic acid-binding protein
MTTFLDTNVLIYLLDEGSQHHEWSIDQLANCKAKGPAVVSDIVYCEMAVGMATQEEVDAAVAKFALERAPNSDEVLFRAAMAFQQYKKNGGPKSRVLPDFLVGAIAEVAGAALVTVNGGDFKNYFPTLNVISPP